MKSKAQLAGKAGMVGRMLLQPPDEPARPAAPGTPVVSLVASSDAGGGGGGIESGGGNAISSSSRNSNSNRNRNSNSNSSNSNNSNSNINTNSSSNQSESLQAYQAFLPGQLPPAADDARGGGGEKREEEEDPVAAALRQLDKLEEDARLETEAVRKLQGMWRRRKARAFIALMCRCGAGRGAARRQAGRHGVHKDVVFRQYNLAVCARARVCVCVCDFTISVP
jgi:hypothetical protein